MIMWVEANMVFPQEKKRETDLQNKMILRIYQLAKVAQSVIW